MKRLPPYHNIPIRTELGREIRRAFIESQPPFPDVDYATLERRIWEQMQKEKKPL